MSLERAWAIPRTDLMTFLQAGSLCSSNFQKELFMGPDAFKSAFEYVHGPERNARSEPQRPATVFQAEMPGAMTLKEVGDQIDLGRWKMKLRNRLVSLKVRLERLESRRTNG